MQGTQRALGSRRRLTFISFFVPFSFVFCRVCVLFWGWACLDRGSREMVCGRRSAIVIFLYLFFFFYFAVLSRGEFLSDTVR